MKVIFSKKTKTKKKCFARGKSFDKYNCEKERCHLNTLLPYCLSAFKKCAAFTLAEVLITIGIIGVVAALTIPNLISAYKKTVVVTKLKSTYVLLQQAIKLSEVHNEPLETWDIPNAAWNNDQQYTLGKPFAEKYILPYVETSVKDCGLRPNKCLPYSVYKINKTKDNNYGALVNHYYVFMLKNGVAIELGLYGSFVSMKVYTNRNVNSSTIGKDIFHFILVKSDLNNADVIVNKPGLYLEGYGYNRTKLINDNSRGCNKSSGGNYCNALIMLDGWKISNDYPW